MELPPKVGRLFCHSPNRIIDDTGMCGKLFLSYRFLRAEIWDIFSSQILYLLLDPYEECVSCTTSGKDPISVAEFLFKFNFQFMEHVHNVEHLWTNA